MPTLSERFKENWRRSEKLAGVDEDEPTLKNFFKNNAAMLAGVTGGMIIGVGFWPLVWAWTVGSGIDLYYLRRIHKARSGQ